MLVSVYGMKKAETMQYVKDDPRFQGCPKIYILEDGSRIKGCCGGVKTPSNI